MRTKNIFLGSLQLKLINGMVPLVETEENRESGEIPERSRHCSREMPLPAIATGYTGKAAGV